MHYKLAIIMPIFDRDINDQIDILYSSFYLEIN